MNIKWWRIFLHAISFGILEIVQYALNAMLEYKDGKKYFQCTVSLLVETW